MRIEFYYFDQCPSYHQALENLKEAQRREDVQEEVTMIQVVSAEDARAKRFVGSPTIRIDGEDLEGLEAEKKGFGYGCRTYSEKGSRAGWPSVALIQQALRTAVKAGSSAVGRLPEDE